MTPTGKTPTPEFGPRLDGVDYIDRPSVYAVIEDTESRIAVILFDGDIFLPGGGKEPRESDQEALKRELTEETGYTAVVQDKIGEAAEYLRSVSDGKYYRVHARFYRAELGERIGEVVELDHRLIWIGRAEAIKHLTREGHAFAITDLGQACRKK